MEDILLKNYEVIFILTPQLGETDLDKAKEEISGLITKYGGTMSFKESEKRNLAYPINKQNLGIYLTTQISLSPESLIGLSKQFKLDKRILRYIISQLEVSKPEIEKPRAFKKLLPKKKTATTEIKKSTSETKEIKLEEIDKKLNELIDKI